jgi:hypothetical protein
VLHCSSILTGISGTNLAFEDTGHDEARSFKIVEWVFWVNCCGPDSIVLRTPFPRLAANAQTLFGDRQDRHRVSVEQEDPELVVKWLPRDGQVPIEWFLCSQSVEEKRLDLMALVALVVVVVVDVVF